MGKILQYLFEIEIFTNPSFLNGIVGYNIRHMLWLFVVVSHLLFYDCQPLLEYK